jgi:hyperosmotically inducible periplasmic protein
MKTTKPLTLLILIAGASPLLFAETASDRRIERTAKNSYNFHVVLQDNVKATSQDGVVILTGTVEDEGNKTLAEDTVNQIPDVTRVDDQITVNSRNAEHSDGWIAFKIHSALLFKANVSATNTTVTVNDGVVTLTGTADTEAQKELTAQIVKDIEGVKSVTNDLTVGAAGSSNSTDGQRLGAKMDDASITAEVKYELLTHHSTSAIKTKVTTRRGVVMISGEANSDAERDLVTKLAQDVRGVQSVRNDMTLKSGL